MIRRGKMQMMFHLQTYIYFPVYNPSFPGEIPVDDTDTLRKDEPI